MKPVTNPNPNLYTSPLSGRENSDTPAAQKVNKVLSAARRIATIARHLGSSKPEPLANALGNSSDLPSARSAALPSTAAAAKPTDQALEDAWTDAAAAKSEEQPAAGAAAVAKVALPLIGKEALKIGAVLCRKFVDDAPHGMISQAQKCATDINGLEGHRGDVEVTHNLIYIGNGKVVHAAGAPYKQVIVHNLEQLPEGEYLAYNCDGDQNLAEWAAVIAGCWAGGTDAKKDGKEVKDVKVKGKVHNVPENPRIIYNYSNRDATVEDTRWEMQDDQRKLKETLLTLAKSGFEFNPDENVDKVKAFLPKDGPEGATCAELVVSTYVAAAMHIERAHQYEKEKGEIEPPFDPSNALQGPLLQVTPPKLMPASLDHLVKTDSRFTPVGRFIVTNKEDPPNSEKKPAETQAPNPSSKAKKKPS